MARMKPRCRSRLSALATLLSALSACSSASSPLPTDRADGAVISPGEIPLADLTKRASEAICGALFRCCGDDLETYFAPFANNELLSAYRPMLPPAATLDESSCRAVLEPMLAVVPLGDWVRASAAGLVTYDPAAAAACVTALETATCGAPSRDALWDSRCFGFAPPSGGDERRAFVARNAGPGTSCAPIRDGIGASFYGTCDPSRSFCCYEEAGRAGCQYPFDGAGTARTGTCTAVAPVGAACSAAAPLQLCATGNDCDAETERCVGASMASLAVGDTCVDAGYHVLGECQGSYCDVLGTHRCEPKRVDGHACSGADECMSNRCQSVCIPMDLCTGMPSAPTIDAGISDAPVAMPDTIASGNPETCVGAPSLVASSSTSPMSGYTSRIARAFGATNDYNPLMSSGLPPHCAFAYDSKGNEVVYEVTLAPGDRLRLRAELADGKQAAVYLLSSCPAGAWPDFDTSGACGSNEYAAGFCGPVGCDPATLDVRYPTMIGGQPTTSATFWVVIDEVGAASSSGFTLDWQLVH